MVESSANRALDRPKERGGSNPNGVGARLALELPLSAGRTLMRSVPLEIHNNCKRVADLLRSTGASGDQLGCPQGCRHFAYYSASIESGTAIQSSTQNSSMVSSGGQRRLSGCQQSPLHPATRLERSGKPGLAPPGCRPTSKSLDPVVHRLGTAGSVPVSPASIAYYPHPVPSSELGSSTCGRLDYGNTYGSEPPRDRTAVTTGDEAVGILVTRRRTSHR